MCGFYAEAEDRSCSVSDELEELQWFSCAELADAITNTDVLLPPPVSIAFRLISDWYREQCGGDLELLARQARGKA
jgi:NAD+ diphosphatase